MPLDRALLLSKKLRTYTFSLKNSFPKLKESLSQAELDIKVEDYLGVSMIASISTFVMFIFISIILLVFSKDFSMRAIMIMSFFTIVMTVFSFFYVITYPSFLVGNRMKALESTLLFAMRHLLIRIKSGINLFDAMKGIAGGDYGNVSKEFDIIVNQINSGIPEIEALEDAAKRNPSKYFRRVVWQIANALRAGVDISKTIGAIIGNLSEEQKIKVKQYGATLNPLALVYMMLTVVIPSLGVTFLIVFASFADIQIPKVVFYAIPAALIVFQYSFMGIVKTRRPAIEV